MLLVIDNYDSFTYNLVQYLGELGAEMKVVRNDEVTVDEIESELKPERILISPGPGTPDSAGISLGVIERFAGHGCRSSAFVSAIRRSASISAARSSRAPEPVHGKPVEIAS